MEFISLAEAQRRLSENVVVCLEPDDRLEAARAKDAVRTPEDETAGKPKAVDALWCFDPATGRSGRRDGKFFDVRLVDRGGWYQLAIYEEPNLPEPTGHAIADMADGIEVMPPPRRVIGQVIVEVNTTGRVYVRRVRGLNGDVLELRPSSLSKGELAALGDELMDFIEANPQRIGGGHIAVYRHTVDFPDEEGLTPTEFRQRSTDGRSLAALAKCGL